mmetsp:Transcript_18239/g.29365  ORF Transcript_18239/g.29365 Transcript_18239/m.29365 type:complete len:345 (+) Transcript_18239:350-1384(+)|eukprot:CAMPEP_0171496680 /NCGR_PEP_ID=MMETSP0958-20121227/6841_1 /TAXON_ID=87120 /ORGANISM="Aurantiochytrium limacinum, Strain ATCCMYA-1381" /LENGTH=344 /DNA_ID=CAMNT_0012030819 /DNA_START=398 /DNA_END=1432 /DNA_ORIENTATION=+
MWKTVLIVGGGSPAGRAVLDILLKENKASRVVLTTRSGEIADLPANTETVSVEVQALDLIEGDLQDLRTLCQEIKPDVIFSCVIMSKNHIKAWGLGWPKIANRLLFASKAVDAPLIFLDNFYAFGPQGMERMPLRENDIEFDKISKNGIKTRSQVRALITRKLLADGKSGEAKIALIRAADYFGPRVTESVLGNVWVDVFKNRTPTLLGDPTKLHAQTYVQDIARVLVLVAENPDTWGRAWHVPTQKDMSTEDWLREIIRSSGKKASESKLNYSISDGSKLRLLSFVKRDNAGLRDSLYMWRGDFTVDSSEFMERFPGFQPTPLNDALLQTNQWLTSSLATKAK